jgi:hypothetical protein
LGNLTEDEDIYRASDNIKENMKTLAKEGLGLHELKQHTPSFYEECLYILDPRKQAKMQGVQDPSQSNADNQNTVRSKASRHFRNQMKEYLKATTEELENNSKIKKLGACIGASMTLRRVTSFELMQQKIRRVISLQTLQYCGLVEEIFLPTIECTWD